MKNIFYIAAALLLFSCTKEDDVESKKSLSIISFSPAEAAFDEYVTIKGTGFSTNLNDMYVLINYINVPIISATPTQLVVKIPKDKRCSGKLEVKVNGKSTEASTPFTYILTYSKVITFASPTRPDGKPNGADCIYANILSQAIDVCIDKDDDVYISNGLDFYRITASGDVKGYRHGLLRSPWGIAVNSLGSVFVSNGESYGLYSGIYKFSPQQYGSQLYNFTLVAGTTSYNNETLEDDDAFEVRLNHLKGMAVDTEDNIIFLDKARYRIDAPLSPVIRKYNPTTRRVSTISGFKGEGYVDGPASIASFSRPTYIAIDNQGNIIISDTGNHCIRRITPDGQVSTIAGSGIAGYANGVGAAAKFNGPTGIAIDQNGNILVSDFYNYCIRKITPDGIVSTLAGNRIQGYKNGDLLDASFSQPRGLSIDLHGNIYVCDGEGSSSGWDTKAYGYVRKIVVE